MLFENTTRQTQRHGGVAGLRLRCTRCSRRTKRLPHALHSRIQVRDHERCIHAQHAPTQARQLAVPARVLGSDARVIFAIDIDRDADGGRSQIDDEAANDKLATEGNS